MWINFSKEYKEEYDKLIKEDNASKLVCKLLREYYNGKSIENDKISEIYNMIKNINTKDIEIEEEKEDDFIIW